MSLLTESKIHSTSSNTLSQKDAIQLESVSVGYRVPHERIGTFKEYAIRWLQGQVRYHRFWALHDVSLNVRKGEVFGLIGQNGAGKSTLLKLVARVLRPSQGRIVVRGRVAPLLEVGAGFHPELTGRENVYLNGAMLGMTRREMDARFEKIVDFAELHDFIDAPLRTYSSGMWARLGFAVATDVEPDILIVDEILSVGDAAFQHKSTRRIDSFRERGTTILLVSHNMEMIEKMCQQAAWLDHGKLIAIGDAKSVVDRYLGRVREDESKQLGQPVSDQTDQRWGSRKIEIHRVQILNEKHQPQAVFSTGDCVILEMEYSVKHRVESPIFGIAIHRADGVHITGPNTHFAGIDLGKVTGRGKVIYTIPKLALLEGEYCFSVASTNFEDTELFDYHHLMYPFRVDNHGANIRERYGMLMLDSKWEHHPY
jgi:ABC-type polysaccharide/polyol phosphate transport system ATPase subunit